MTTRLLQLTAADIDQHIADLVRALNTTDVKPTPEIIIAMAVLAFDLAQDGGIPLKLIHEVLDAYELDLARDPNADAAYSVLRTPLTGTMVLPRTNNTH